MAVDKPFRRTCRPFVDGTYYRSGYIKHPSFAREPEHYVRAFQILQDDLKEMFEYVEPADANGGCYSYRIHALHMRVCIEVEANCKAILVENGYSRSKPSSWNMDDYKKLETTHRLSGYEVRLPVWSGQNNIRKPFEAWCGGNSLAWYQDYNAAKHDRHEQFTKASFNSLIDATCGLLALLSSQFCKEDFGPSIRVTSEADDFDNAIGRYLRVKFPTDWPPADRYDFDWSAIKDQVDPFQTLQF